MSKINPLTGIRGLDRRKFLTYLSAAPALTAFTGAGLLSSPHRTNGRVAKPRIWLPASRFSRTRVMSSA